MRHRIGFVGVVATALSLVGLSGTALAQTSANLYSGYYTADNPSGQAAGKARFHLLAENGVSDVRIQAWDTLTDGYCARAQVYWVYWPYGGGEAKGRYSKVVQDCGGAGYTSGYLGPEDWTGTTSAPHIGSVIRIGAYVWSAPVSGPRGNARFVFCNFHEISSSWSSRYCGSFFR